MQPDTLAVSDVRLVPAGTYDAMLGLLGYVSCTIGGALRLDGIALRRTLTGRLALSFPTRRDRAGRAHAYIRPLDDEARQAIEAEVFDALGIEQDAVS